MASLSSAVADELQAILRGLLGGARYGVKIRFPHTLIMTLLFPRLPTLHGKMRYIAKQTMAHASRLAVFAATYKILLALLKYHFHNRPNRAIRIQRQGSLPSSSTTIIRRAESLLSFICTSKH